MAQQIAAFARSDNIVHRLYSRPFLAIQEVTVWEGKPHVQFVHHRLNVLSLSTQRPLSALQAPFPWAARARVCDVRLAERASAARTLESSVRRGSIH